VERETGLLKDTLRVWERRYGFPKPIRDEAGERLYSLEDVGKLRLIRRLMDQGWRPGKLLAASAAELQLIIEAEQASRVPALLAGEILDAIRSHDVEALRRVFQQTLLEKGLQGLVTDLVAPLNVDIGEA
ncbi:MerR family transcriptional regulator, partial [Acinetobacter baumannii]